jgi:hypothetical protein
MYIFEKTIFVLKFINNSAVQNAGHKNHPFIRSSLASFIFVARKVEPPASG